MSMEIVVPPLGESVSEATIARWTKRQGDAVQQDELLVELETDKVTLEVTAPCHGVLESLLIQAGKTVTVGMVLGTIQASGTAAGPSSAKASSAPVFSAAAGKEKKSHDVLHAPLSPAVRKMVAEQGLDPSSMVGSGKDGRLTKGDVLQQAAGAGGAGQSGPASAAVPASGSVTSGTPMRTVERHRMTRLRKRIAERLKESQNTAAMLTTFNEINMAPAMALRQKYKESFEKKHGIKLGFMSFFVKAAVAALQDVPAVNAQIDGDDVVYHRYCDIGVAVGTEQGLVVPILRNAEQLSFAGIEQAITALGKKARDGKLTMEDLTGGTFTISNGGVYGSLLSTPIINPPQSGILGMHSIQERPVVIQGKIEIAPMMYVALSYDHRIIDGKEAVTFLVRMKEYIESPERLLLDI